MKLALLAFTSCIAAAQTFPVAGIVVDSETGSPVRRVRVVLSTRPQMTMVTGEDGRFSFPAPKGKFSFFGERLGWRQPFGGGFGSAVITGPDQDTAHLVFKWYTPGAIYGRVVDDRGDPVANALVQLIRNPMINGRRHASTGAWERTDDRGNYRFGPVASGVYYLIATGEPWYTQMLRFNRNVARGQDAAPNEPTPGYAPCYYPNAADARGASPLVVKAGAESSADFTLRTITGANLRFTCASQPRCSGLVSLYGEGINGVESVVQQGYVQLGRAMEGVPPGHYTVHYEGMRKPIDVDAGDRTIELAPQPAPSVSGKVVFQNPNVKPKRTLYVRMVNQDTGFAVARAMDADGGFSWANLAIGKYRAEIGSAEGFFAVQTSAEGAVVADGVVDVIEGASVRLTITATDETGRFKGFVMTGDKPVPAALVVLAPLHDSNESAAYRGFQTDSDGSFDFQNVRAGDYYAFALDSTEGLEYANPAVIRPYFANAQKIRVEAHQTGQQNLSLSTQVRQAIP
jgi:hypothetical protein